VAVSFLVGGLAVVASPLTSAAQRAPDDPSAARQRRIGALLDPGWHPHVAAAPAFPLNRLGELTSLGVTGHLGAWYIPSRRGLPGVGFDVTYASFSRDTDEPLPGRYEMVGVSGVLSSKGRQRLFFDWLGAYGTVGGGVYRHGPAGGPSRTAAAASASLGVLVPIGPTDGFVETRFQHLFTGEVLGRGNGLTFAPLMMGVRF
jgi:hypothetical protein